MKSECVLHEKRVCVQLFTSFFGACSMLMYRSKRRVSWKHVSSAPPSAQTSVLSVALAGTTGTSIILL